MSFNFAFNLDTPFLSFGRFIVPMLQCLLCQSFFSTNLQNDIYNYRVLTGLQVNFNDRYFNSSLANASLTSLQFHIVLKLDRRIPFPLILAIWKSLIQSREGILAWCVKILVYAKYTKALAFLYNCCNKAPLYAQCKNVPSKAQDTKGPTLSPLLHTAAPSE